MDSFRNCTITAFKRDQQIPLELFWGEILVSGKAKVVTGGKLHLKPAVFLSMDRNQTKLTMVETPFRAEVFNFSQSSN